ncbi:hypothetical protein J1N35_037198 [Gossypium stocksii]|uniref:CCHC-type domain-containing protein n=1 Tax=Gossypium stocksii TaxID=47602 RepID=A0A9D3ZLG4_9ROSI|nr:hypothetical protein J1N35_037198 [Gossypium stocksii]
MGDKKDSEGKQSLPTLGSGNSELGNEALAELVRKVVEEVLETKVKEIRETLQVGCLECKKSKDHSSQRTESRSVKHVSARPNFSTCKNCNRRHPGECHREKRACFRCGSREHRAQDCQAYSS